MNSRKRASIIVISVFIAACALFTAVYDGLKSRDVSPTSILNAATVDHTGKNAFSVMGTKYNGAETTTLNFDQGTYMVMFVGQSGQSIRTGSVTDTGAGAVCLAFYKGSSMAVAIGVGGGTSDNSGRGGGATIVTTNFAKPVGYDSVSYEAIAAGSGGAGVDDVRIRYSNPEILVDGTFAGWADMSFETRIYGRIAGYDGSNFDKLVGAPASQVAGGWMANYGNIKVRQTNAHTFGDGSLCGSGGGAGYYDGGCGYWRWNPGGGGSCTPWCYPLQASDVDNGIRLATGTGWVDFFRIDPTVMPSGAEVNLAEDPEAVAGVTAGGDGPYTPVSAVGGFLSNDTAGLSYDCGIETGWVFRWRRL